MMYYTKRDVYGWVARPLRYYGRVWYGDGRGRSKCDILYRQPNVLYAARKVYLALVAPRLRTYQSSHPGSLSLLKSGVVLAIAARLAGSREQRRIRFVEQHLDADFLMVLGGRGCRGGRGCCRWWCHCYDLPSPVLWLLPPRSSILGLPGRGLRTALLVSVFASLPGWHLGRAHAAVLVLPLDRVELQRFLVDAGELLLSLVCMQVAFV